MKIKITVIFLMIILNTTSLFPKEIKQNEIFKNLRCLVCQGQSISDSNSDFAQTIKLVVQDLIKDGYSEKEIYSFLAEKYGEWIVFKPSFNAMNFALWTFPYLALIIGGVIIFLLFKKRENR